VISNSAGAGLAKSKWPAGSAWSSVDWPVFKFLAVTLAPAMAAPAAEVTVPESAAPACACAKWEVKRAAATVTADHRENGNVDFMKPLLN
jgi:hypothetical protein